MALIVSSPYTRALQTAQIISRETGLRVEVELDLHEWVPDWENRYTTSEESFALAREFTKYRGEYPPGVWPILKQCVRRKLWNLFTKKDNRIANIHLHEENDDI